MLVKCSVLAGKLKPVPARLPRAQSERHEGTVYPKLERKNTSALTSTPLNRVLGWTESPISPQTSTLTPGPDLTNAPVAERSQISTAVLQDLVENPHRREELITRIEGTKSGTHTDMMVRCSHTFSHIVHVTPTDTQESPAID